MSKQDVIENEKLDQENEDEDDLEEGTDGVDLTSIATSVEEKYKKKMKEDDDEEEEDDDDSDDDDSDDEDDEDEDDVKEKNCSKKMKESVSYSEIAQQSVAMVTEGMEDVSEDFKTKAETIFESAIATEVKKIREELETEFSEKVAEVEEQTIAQIDEYLDYVVKEWIEENKIEVEKGLKVQMAESFFDDFKNLLQEHNVMIPDEKIDLLEAKTKEMEDLEAKVSELTESVLTARKEIFEHEKKDVLAQLSEGLAETQKEKLSTLVEDIEAKDKETFAEKVKIIKESHFKDKVSKDLSEEKTSEETEEELSPYMKAYFAKAKTSKQSNF